MCLMREKKCNQIFLYKQNCVKQNSEKENISIAQLECVEGFQQQCRKEREEFVREDKR